MHELQKPPHLHHESLELYHYEHASIDSSTTVMAACGTCHDLNSIHPHEKKTTAAGIGITVGPVGGAATIDTRGRASLSVFAGNNGPVVVATATQISNTGPHYRVNTGTRQVRLGGQFGAASAHADNTRAGG